MWTTICRVCESKNDLKSLTAESNKFVLKKLRACADIVIDLNDELPKYLCQRCNQHLNDAYRFKIKCEYADQKFRDQIRQKQQQYENENESTEMTILMGTIKNNDVDENACDSRTSFDCLINEQEEVANNSDDNEDNILIIKAESITEDSLIIKDIEYDESCEDVITFDENIIEEYIDDNESRPMVDCDNNCDDSITTFELFNENSSSAKQIKLNETTIIDDESFIEFDSLKEEEEYDNEINENHVLPSATGKKCLILSHENPLTELQKNFSCDTCNEKFDNLVKFNEHKKSHGKQRYQCSDCLKWFPKRYLMKNHQATHAGIKSYPCPVCPKLYTNQGNRDRHIRVFHQKQRTHFCSRCNKSFSQLSILRQHYSVHTAERNFICEICQKSYKTQEYLNLHKYRHLPREMRARRKINNHIVNFSTKTTKIKSTIATNSVNNFIFECSVCGKQSTTIVLHQNHMRTHTGEKPYNCYVCTKRFSFSQSLKNHLLLHTGEKPHKCDICDMSFRQIGHLQGHKLTHTGQKVHSCTVCNKSFALRGNLTVHMRLHTGETPYHCKLCPKQFYDLKGLKKHQLFHDNKTDITTFTNVANKNIDPSKSNIQFGEKLNYQHPYNSDYFENNMQIVKIDVVNENIVETWNCN